ncbi:MAG TPA: hypothetical protein IAC31_03800 [Candidatus Faecousia intestinigallinarum]|nr:hypothetical protein [Candidatus Faecousia intestinigallinarum]
MNGKRGFCVLLAVLFALLAGCQGETQGMDVASGHVYEEVSENLIIDADVIAPEDGVHPKVYSGYQPVFTREQLEAFAEALGQKVASVDEGRDWVDAPYINITCESGAALGYNYMEGYPYGNLGFSDWTAMEPYYDYPIYSSLDDYWRNGHWRLSDLFFEPAELHFGTAAEAAADIRRIFATLGLDLALRETLYLSKDRLAEMHGALETLPNPTRPGETLPLPQEWTEEDECYIFEFACAVDGFPMSMASWTGETYVHHASSLVVWYNAHGIFEFGYMGFWIPEEVLEEPTETVSAGEALAKAKEKLRNLLDGQKREVFQVNLEYDYIPDGDGWKLYPVWNIYVREKSNWVTGAYTVTNVLYDAVTGDEV